MDTAIGEPVQRIGLLHDHIVRLVDVEYLDQHVKAVWPNIARIGLIVDVGAIITRHNRHLTMRRLFGQVHRSTEYQRIISYREALAAPTAIVTHGDLAR